MRVAELWVSQHLLTIQHVNCFLEEIDAGSSACNLAGAVETPTYLPYHVLSDGCSSWHEFDGNLLICEPAALLNWRPAVGHIHKRQNTCRRIVWKAYVCLSLRHLAFLMTFEIWLASQHLKMIAIREGKMFGPVDSKLHDAERSSPQLLDTYILVMSFQWLTHTALRLYVKRPRGPRNKAASPYAAARGHMSPPEEWDDIYAQELWHLHLLSVRPERNNRGEISLSAGGMPDFKSASHLSIMDFSNPDIANEEELQGLLLCVNLNARYKRTFAVSWVPHQVGFTMTLEYARSPPEDGSYLKGKGYFVYVPRLLSIWETLLTPSATLSLSFAITLPPNLATNLSGCHRMSSSLSRFFLSAAFCTPYRIKACAPFSLSGSQGTSAWSTGPDIVIKLCHLAS